MNSAGWDVVNSTGWDVVNSAGGGGGGGVRVGCCEQCRGVRCKGGML